MKAETLMKIDSLLAVGVTSFTATLEAVCNVLWTAIVTNRNDTFVFYDDTPDRSLHAVRSLSNHVGDVHEVNIELCSDVLGQEEVECLILNQLRIEVLNIVLAD